MRGLAFAFVLFCTALSVAVSDLNFEQRAKNSLRSVELPEHEILIRPHRSKRDLGTTLIVVGLLSGLGSLGFTRQQAEAAARRHREQINFKIRELCVQICVTEWDDWNECDRGCGGGSRTRHRYNQSLGRCAEIPNFRCTKSLTQTEPCNTGCPNGGELKGPGDCQCDPKWKGECCLEEVQCAHPGRPHHGDVTGKEWPAKYGHVAHYTCDHGYKLNGQSEATCQTDESWSHASPICEAILCPLPTLGDQAAPLNIKDAYRVGEQLFHGCAEGYEMNGSPIQICEQSGNIGVWQGVTPKCEKVSCGDPGSPLHGQRIGDSFAYTDEVSFSCEEGYQLQGSAKMFCMSNAKWTGTKPTCEAIMCDALEAPSNADILSSNTHYGGRTVFACHEGHLMQGEAELTCTGDGQWDADPPTCIAAICPDPIVPNHCSKDGNRFYFPYNVTYHCFAGYTMTGAAIVSCLADGTWSEVPPTCNACPINTYDAGDSEMCLDCSPHSHTFTPASQRKEQCVCDDGYSGPPGGPCEEMSCTPLEAPDNGQVLSCEGSIGSFCNMTCDDGYIIRTGSNTRLCLPNGQWGGRNFSCMACAKDTYKMGESQCVSCPAHSHTDRDAAMRDDCVCDQGYEKSPAGQCMDTNECLVNNGGCEDQCVNEVGRYKCKCNVYGYIVNPEDGHSCRVDKECRNLTQDDAPENGGLVCHSYRSENSKYCAVKCNKGFEHPTRVNNYETCASSTGFNWTFENVGPGEDPILEPCIELFFGGFELESESAYFVRGCSDLTDEERKNVTLQFTETLNNNDVCKRNNLKLCDIKDTSIVCGRTTRYRRDTGETYESADLGFGIEAKQLGNTTLDCPLICTALRIPPQYCDQMCLKTYQRYLKASVIYAKRQMLSFYRDESKLSLLKFSAAHREFLPKSRGFKAGPVQVKCQTGMMSRNDACYQCYSGTYHNVQQNTCMLCPKGMYQPDVGQTECLPCPRGTSTPRSGGRSCTPCPDGRFGLMCREECQCVNGKCDPVDGSCECPGGWEGARCEQDTDGCASNECGAGQQCTDIPAPGMGFVCSDSK